MTEPCTADGETEYEAFNHEGDYEPAEGDRVTVRYESARSDERQTMSGVVTSTSRGSSFWLDTGEEFDGGEPKTYKVSYRTVRSTTRSGGRFTLTPKVTSHGTVEIRVDERGGDDE